jgi:NADH-quinone oxidoreductase subunit A
MLENYLAILVFLGVGFAVGIALPIVGYFVSPKKPDAQKLSTYECGFEPFDGARAPFDVRFYLVAILFIIFDLETAFLVPWALVFRDLGMAGMVVMFVFLFLLTVGFVYEWKKGGLEWE